MSWMEIEMEMESGIVGEKIIEPQLQPQSADYCMVLMSE